MTKLEALEAMRAGKKVTHAYFTDTEYIYMNKDREITSEDGVIHGAQFWDLRSGESWQHGWEIFEERKPAQSD